ncbi:MAG: diguanylate cyclase [Gammaproteobacteria bacterium]|nr:diguanylate cyclase [Gammaproteobacteria bacterium]
MIKPPTPVDELLRLETLRNLKILDTDPEERFDRITRLAKTLFNTPIALVSLVDADRQWFKSRQGLSARQTPREISFCGHAILNKEPLVVSDAQDDERFADNPLVTEDPNIRFYAGCPLSGPGGHKVGTLCLIDEKPRGMTKDELNLLKELGRLVEEELVVADFLKVDPATGISNRAGFAMVADHLLSMCARNRVPASILLLHNINHEFISMANGGDESDRVAIEITQLILATFHDSDVVGRLSHDLFAVLVTGTQHHDIGTISDQFLTRVDERNSRSGDDYPIEIESCAIKYDKKLHESTESLIENAESVLEDIALDATGKTLLSSA